MKTIKKIMALATGATMLGATLMGAMAADLADYPSPLLIKDTTFDGQIVFGDGAAASDVAGAVDIVASLGVIETDEVVTAVEEVTATGESTKIETSTMSLTLGSDSDNLTDVQTVDIDDDDLPNVLADGTYENDEGEEFDYEQTLTLADTVQFKLVDDDDYEDDAPQWWWQ